LALEAAISVPSSRAPHFASNRNALTLFHHCCGIPALLLSMANDATESRRLVLFCAARIAAHIRGSSQSY
jgi:hypothetical protein